MKELLSKADPPGHRSLREPVVAAAAGNRFLRWGEVQGRTGLSRSTVWRLEKAERFPRRRWLSPNAVGWLESEVEAWIASRVSGARHLPPTESTSGE